MRNYLIIGIILFFGGKYGFDFLRSDKFEIWADANKHPATCYFENIIGQLHIVMSEYKKGYFRFSHTLSRCPETSMAEEAMYGTARCLEGLARRPEAANMYEQFAAKHPGTKRAVTATKAAEILRGS